MNEPPTNLVYAATHEWVKQLDNDIVEVGISDFAQQALGDVVYVELPELGQQVDATEQCCAVESVKAASDIHAPLSGEIYEVNDALNDEPELLNDSPYEAGWMFRIKASDLSELDTLFDVDGYLAQIDE